MGRLRFILVGKPHSPELENLYEDYRKRLLKYADTKVEYAREVKLPERPSPSQIQKALDDEAEAVLKTIGRTDCVIALDLKGTESDSETFAREFSKLSEQSANLVFIVGSSYGISPRIRQRADYLWRLSTLTFTHPLALLVSMEQVYRAFKINRGETYHK